MADYDLAEAPALRAQSNLSKTCPIWDACVTVLKQEFSEQAILTWILPLIPAYDETAHVLSLLAPNQFVLDRVKERFLSRLNEFLAEHSSKHAEKRITIRLSIGSGHAAAAESTQTTTTASADERDPQPRRAAVTAVNPAIHYQSNLNKAFTFDAFVVGSSNEVPFAAARQVAEKPGGSFNPFCVYGPVGLGKTHLIHAIGNRMLELNPDARVVYLHSERFVSHMVKSLQTNNMEEFKNFYRNADALLIDDIQFFSGKERSQEEFFHTFNSLLEGHKQIMITCDRYPKELKNVEERLRSRFSWGLTVLVEPPELETRVAILMRKADQSRIALSPEVAFFIAKRIPSNVRELEGALKRVIANAHFTGKPIDLDMVKEALKDLLALQDRLVTIDNIIKTTSEYYKIKVSDLLSRRRSRSVAMPRQMAMCLAKELTQHSFPEIGEAFGGRDHTTVMHAYRKIKALVDKDLSVTEDYHNLVRILTG